MKLAELLLADLEREAPGTRRTLERMPEGRSDWKPHEKSMPLGYLASLVATLPSWAAMMIEADVFDMRSAESSEFHPTVYKTAAELVAAHEDAMEKARRALRGATEESLLQEWTLRMGDKVLDKGPRHIKIRDAVLNHLAHHRGQLTVYLRLNEAAVPALYGPSADEPLF